MTDNTIQIILKAIDNASPSINIVKGGLAAVGVAAAAAAAATVALGAKGTQMAADFQEGLANVNSLLGGNSERIKTLGDDVKRIAAETGTPLGTLTDGLYQVVSAFGDSADTAKLLDINARAAAAGLATTEQAVALTSAVTKGYGDVSAEAAQKAADLAFKTVELGQTTFPELAASMGRVVPIASTLNVSQEELFATMATATGVTGGAAEVSTQLRGALQSLSAPTASMTALYDKLGVSSGEALLEQEGLHGALQAVVGAAEASGEPLQKFISSIEGQTLALTLAGSQSDTYVSKLDSMVNASGAASQAFDIQQSSVNAMIQQIRTAGNVILVSFGEKILPILDEFLTWVVANLPIILATIDTTFTTIDAVITVVTRTVSNLIDAFRRGFAPNGEASLLLTGFRTIVDNVISSIKLAFEGLNLLLTGDFVGAWQTYQTLVKENFQQTLTGIVQIVAGLAERAFNFGKTIMSNIAVGFRTQLEPFITILNDVGAGVMKQIVEPFMNAIEQSVFMQKALAGVQGVFANIADAAKAFGRTIGGVAEVIIAFSRGTGAVLKELGAQLKSFGPELAQFSTAMVQLQTGNFVMAARMFRGLENPFDIDALRRAFNDEAASKLEYGKGEIESAQYAFADLETSLASTLDTMQGIPEFFENDLVPGLDLRLTHVNGVPIGSGSPGSVTSTNGSSPVTVTNGNSLMGGSINMIPVIDISNNGAVVGFAVGADTVTPTADIMNFKEVSSVMSNFNGTFISGVGPGSSNGSVTVSNPPQAVSPVTITGQNNNFMGKAIMPLIDITTDATVGYLIGTTASAGLDITTTASAGRLITTSPQLGFNIGTTPQVGIDIGNNLPTPTTGVNIGGTLPTPEATVRSVPAFTDQLNNATEQLKVFAVDSVPFAASAIEGFAAGGPLGAVTAVLLEMLAASEPFVEYLKVLADATKPLIEIVGKLLTPALKLLGDVITGIVNFIVDIYNFTLGRIFGKVARVGVGLGDPDPPEQTTRANNSSQNNFGGIAPAVQLGIAIPLKEAVDALKNFVGGANSDIMRNHTQAMLAHVVALSAHTDMMRRQTDEGITVSTTARGAQSRTLALRPLDVIRSGTA